MCIVWPVRIGSEFSVFLCLGIPQKSGNLQPDLPLSLKRPVLGDLNWHFDKCIFRWSETLSFCHFTEKLEKEKCQWGFICPIKLLCISKILYLCCRKWFRVSVRTSGLKGNQVKFLNSPAAVSSFNSSEIAYATDNWTISGRLRRGGKSEDLPSYKFNCTRGIGS